MTTVTQRGGPVVLTIASLIGLAIALYYYFMPMTGVTETPGALLVVISSLLLTLAGIVLCLAHAAWLALTVRFLAGLGCIGTIAAAYFLHEFSLMAVMTVALFAVIADFASKRGS